MIEFLTAHKDAITTILATLAFIISAATFYHTWRRDRRQAKIVEQAKTPLISIRTDWASRERLFLPGPRQHLSGWNYYVHLEIENRFGTYCTIEKISASPVAGAEVRLHQPVGDGFNRYDLDPRELICKRSYPFRPTEPGKIMRPSFHIFIVRELPEEDVRRGLHVEFRFEFELQEEQPRTHVEIRRLPLKPGGVSVKKYPVWDA